MYFAQPPPPQANAGILLRLGHNNFLPNPFQLTIHYHPTFRDYRVWIGRAIAQAVSRRLPTATARVRAQVRAGGICGGHSGTGAGFLRVFRLVLPILIPPTAQHSSFIIRGWYNKPDSGRRTKYTQSHGTSRNTHKKRRRY
jgi:hypothetical protein